MKERVFTMRKEKRAIATLTLHPFYNLMQIVGTDMYEVSTYKYYNLVDQVLSTKGGQILANAIFVQIAEKNGKTEIDVIVIEDVTEEDILRLLNLYSRRLKKKKYAVAVCGEYIDKFWDEGHGKEFYHEIPGTNARDKIAYLLGVSMGGYSSITRIYNFDPELLKKVDAGEVTNEYALNLANEAEVKNNNNKHKGPQKIKTFNEGERDDQAVAPILKVVRFTSIALFAEGYGEIVLTWLGDKVIAKLNGEVLGEAIFAPASPDHGETFHYIVQIPGIGSLHLMGADFRRCQEFLNLNTKNKGGNNDDIQWFG